MDIIVKGVITQALPAQQGVSQKTGNQWQRASYLIEHESGQYPRRMLVDVSNNRIADFNLQVGEYVTLHLNVDAREWNGRYFNSIDVWKVERPQVAAQQDAQQAAQAPQQAVQQSPQVIVVNKENVQPVNSNIDSLPF